MKGEYVKEEKDNISHSMFSAKLHQTRKFHHHTPPPPPPPPHQSASLFHPPFSQTSDEVESQHSPATPKHDPSSGQLVQYQGPSSGNDGATIEVVRRPRGRPPGSKNKPKPPVIITRDSEPSMSPYVLEISGGADILDTIMTFCRARSTGLCILNGSGTVSNVTLRQPSTTPGASVTFHGRFDILSLAATILPPAQTASGAVTNGIANGFTISLAGPQGQVVGGNVVGPLYTAGTVFLIAATFNSPSFHKLPLEEEIQSGSAAAGGGGGSSGVNEGRGQSPSAGSGGGDGGQTGGDSIYSCHLPTEVIWTPTARQPQHPSPY